MSDELKDYSEEEINDIIADLKNSIKEIAKKKIKLGLFSPPYLENEDLEYKKKLKQCIAELESRKKIPPGISGMVEKRPVGKDNDTGKERGDTTNKPKPKKNKFVIVLAIMASLSILFFLYIRFFENSGKTTFEPEDPNQLSEKKASLEVPSGKQDSEVEESKETSPDVTIPSTYKLSFQPSVGEITVESESRLEINGKFKCDSGLFYWICFIDNEYIWPELRIGESKFNKKVTVPKRFNGGKLVLALVNGKVDKAFGEWVSPHPLLRSANEINIIMEIKINIK